MSSEIRCRKCNGNHLTIKCRKTSDKSNDNKSNDNKPNDNKLNDNKLNDNKPNYTRYNDNKLNYTRSNDNKPNDNKPNYTRSNDSKPNYTRSNDSKPNYNRFNDRIIHKVKISNLPKDITKDELSELLYEWGNVKYININEYVDESVAYIEFKYEDQCKYLIEALDDTPFDHRIIQISKVNN